MAAAALPERFELTNKTIVVTGASRGLGLEFCKQLLERGNHVVATARNPDAAQGLKALKASNAPKLDIMTLDVADVGSISEWASTLAGKHPNVDVVINNAGVMLGREGILQVSQESMLETFTVNTLGPVFVVQALLKQNLLASGALLATLTSLVGSVTENEGGGLYAYRCSKSAANMAVKSMSIDLKQQGITSTILHPGYVRTDMTSGNGNIDVDVSVKGMLDVLEGEEPLNGEWYHTSGRHLPW